MERRELKDNVYFTYIPSEKFKTGLFSAQLALPLRRETAHLSALLVNVLSRGTERCPDLRALGRELDLLYGARLDATVRKKGEIQLFGFMSDFVDDRFLPAGEGALEGVCALLGEVLLSPALADGHFREDYFAGERDNLSDTIRGEIDQKAVYAGRRLIREMCADEPYGVGRLGGAEDVERATREELEDFYHRVLPAARLELFYCGSAPRERAEEALERAFRDLPRAGRIFLPPAVARKAPDTPRTVEETMDVSQGRLCLGYRAETEDAAAMLLMNCLFGGYGCSRLFRRVREEISLCYDVDSVYHRRKGILTVSAGVEPGDLDRAIAAIGQELELIRQGRWEPWELEGARSYILSTLRTTEDSARALEDFALGQAAAGSAETLSGLASAVEAVTPERVRGAAGSVRPDTIYLLKGRDAVGEA